MPAHVLENKKKDILATIFRYLQYRNTWSYINAKRFSRQQINFDAEITHIMFV